MKKKKSLALLGSICVVLVLAALPLMSACAKPAPKGEPIVLKSVAFWSAGHLTNYGFDLFRERVKELSGGELVIEFTGGPEAIPMFEQAEALGSGIVDVLYTPGSIYASRVPEARGLAFATITPAEQRKTGFYDFLLEAHKAHNMYYLGVASWIKGFYPWLVNPIEKPEELAGLRFPADPGMGPVWKVYGLNYIDMEDAEIWSALDRGLLDGIFNPLGSTLDKSWYEVLKYRVEPALFPASLPAISMNLDTWNGLPPHLQQLLKDMMGPLEDEIYAYSRNHEEEIDQKLMAAGIKSIHFSPADTERYIKMATESGWSLMVEKLGPERVAQMRALLVLK